MSQTIGSFVETLRADGVEVGRAAAEKIRREAEEQAEQTIRGAEAKAHAILEAAERDRQTTLQRTRTDLELAARDTVARLRGALSQAINRLLARAAATSLDDKDFLEKLIREVVSAYAKRDAVGQQILELNVPEPMRRGIADWAIAAFHHKGDDQQLTVELHGTLVSAGFEYKLSDGTVEVTPDSVVQVLSEMVTPQLQALLASSQEGSVADG
jgi:F0F1-type ATP synthase membrane subunit b/b'